MRAPGSEDLLEAGRRQMGNSPTHGVWEAAQMSPQLAGASDSPQKVEGSAAGSTGLRPP